MTDRLFENMSELDELTGRRKTPVTTIGVTTTRRFNIMWVYRK